MANIKIVFQGTEETNTQNAELECFINTHCQITISIDDGHDMYPNLISLDVDTAVKLSKTLRTLIGELKEGFNNG